MYRWMPFYKSPQGKHVPAPAPDLLDQVLQLVEVYGLPCHLFLQPLSFSSKAFDVHVNGPNDLEDTLSALAPGLGAVACGWVFCSVAVHRRIVPATYAAFDFARGLSSALRREPPTTRCPVSLGLLAAACWCPHRPVCSTTCICHSHSHGGF